MKKILSVLIVIFLMSFNVAHANISDLTDEEFYDFFTQYLMCDNEKQDTDTVRRDDFIAYICKAVGMDLPLFRDYAKKSFVTHYFLADERESGYTGYLFFAYCNNIIAGTGVTDIDGFHNRIVFEPKREITYEEAVAFAVRTSVSNNLKLTMDEQWQLGEDYKIINKEDSFYNKRKEKAIYQDVRVIVERVLMQEVNTYFKDTAMEDLAMRRVIRTRTPGQTVQSNFEFIKENFEIDNWVYINVPYYEIWRVLYANDPTFAELYDRLKK